MAKTKVVIMGASGRMGSNLVNLVQRDPELELAAVVEHPDKLQEIDHLASIKGSKIEDILFRVEKGVIVDFTFPDVTIQALEEAKKYNVPVVTGTTGFNAEQQKFLSESAKEIPVFWAPNMSVGINVLLEMLPKLSEHLGLSYDIELSEIHHKHKKDAPSGTAIKLAQNLAQSKGWSSEDTLKYSREGIIGERSQQEIGVQSLRGGDVVGEHTVYFLGPGERIDITHRVYSRETFVQGALRAAKWIIDKGPGKLYTMSDLFASH